MYLILKHTLVIPAVAYKDQPSQLPMYILGLGRVYLRYQRLTTREWYFTVAYDIDSHTDTLCFVRLPKDNMYLGFLVSKHHVNLVR